MSTGVKIVLACIGVILLGCVIDWIIKICRRRRKNEAVRGEMKFRPKDKP